MVALSQHQDKIQYVLDARGNKTAVLIPIEIWNQWSNEDNRENNRQSVSIKQYRGIIKGKGYSGREEEDKMRDEWN